MIPSKKSPRKKRVLLVANSSWYLFNFRRKLARALAEIGYEPVMVAPRDRYSALLEQDGFRYLEFALHRSGMNPAKELGALWQLRRIYAQEQPVAVHHFTLKCAIYGLVAGRAAGVPLVVNSITGLGHAFISERLLMKTVRAAFLFFFKRLGGAENVRTIFQNSDDLRFFLDRRILEQQRCWEIPTSGVDITHFSPLKKQAFRGSLPTVLFAARLLREKGVFEFARAAQLLRERGVQARFVLGGALDPGNPSSLTPAELNRLRHEYGVETPGHIEDMREALGGADIYVLPSYREGGSKTILEASAMCVPVITANVPGCRNLVDHGITGLLVPVRDASALADAIEALAGDEQLRRSMGEAGRRKIEGGFGDLQIAARTLAVYAPVVSSSSSPSV